METVYSSKVYFNIFIPLYLQLQLILNLFDILIRERPPDPLKIIGRNTRIYFSTATLLPHRVSAMKRKKKKKMKHRRREGECGAKEKVIVQLPPSRYRRCWAFGKYLRGLCIEIKVNFICKHSLPPGMWTESQRTMLLEYQIIKSRSLISTTTSCQILFDIIFNM